MNIKDYANSNPVNYNNVSIYNQNYTSWANYTSFNSGSNISLNISDIYNIYTVNNNYTSLGTNNILDYQITNLNVLSFNGASSYVNIDTSGGIYNSPGGVYSVEFLMKSSTAEVNKFLYAEGYGGNTTPYWGISTEDVSPYTHLRVSIRNDAGGTVTIYSNAIVVDGTAHKVSWVDNNGTYALYIDGVLDRSGSYTRTPTTLNKSTIGALTRTTTGYYYAGIVSDVRLWTNARSQSQVQQYQYSRLTGSESGLKAYYKLDEGTGTTANDLTANNYDGTINAGTWTTWTPGCTITLYKVTSAYFGAVDVLKGNAYIDHNVNWNKYNKYTGAWTYYSWQPDLIQTIMDYNAPLGADITINITSPDNYYHNYTDTFTIDRTNGMYIVPLYQNNTSSNIVMLMGHTEDHDGTHIGNVSLVLKNGDIIIDNTTSDVTGAYHFNISRQLPACTLKAYANYSSLTNVQVTLHLVSTNNNQMELNFPSDMMSWTYAGGGSWYVGDTQCDLILDEYVASPFTFSCQFYGIVYTQYPNGTSTTLNTMYPGTIARVGIYDIVDDEFKGYGYTDINGNYNFNVSLPIGGYKIAVTAPNFQETDDYVVVPMMPGFVFTGQNILNKNYILHPASYGGVPFQPGTIILSSNTTSINQGGSVLFHLNINNNNPQDIKAIVYAGGPPGTLAIIYLVYYTDNVSWYKSSDGGDSFQLSTVYEAYNPKIVFNYQGTWLVRASLVNFNNDSIGLSNDLSITVGSASVIFHGICYDYDTDADVIGATITITDFNNSVMGTDTSDSNGAYSITTYNMTIGSSYNLIGSATGYETLMYINLRYPDYYNNGEFYQNLYFYTTSAAPSATAAPTPPIGPHGPIVTLSGEAKHAATTQAVDFWAGLLPFIGMLVILCIVSGIIFRMVR